MDKYAMYSRGEVSVAVLGFISLLVLFGLPIFIHEKTTIPEVLSNTPIEQTVLVADPQGAYGGMSASQRDSAYGGGSSASKSSSSGSTKSTSSGGGTSNSKTGTGGGGGGNSNYNPVGSNTSKTFNAGNSPGTKSPSTAGSGSKTNSGNTVGGTGSGGSGGIRNTTRATDSRTQTPTNPAGKTLEQQRAEQYAKDLANYAEALADQRRGAIESQAAADRFKDLVSGAVDQFKTVFDTLTNQKPQQVDYHIDEYGNVFTGPAQPGIGDPNYNPEGNFDIPTINTPVVRTFGPTANIPQTPQQKINQLQLENPNADPTATSPQSDVIAGNPPKDQSRVTNVAKDESRLSQTPTKTPAEQYKDNLANYGQAVADLRKTTTLSVGGQNVVNITTNTQTGTISLSPEQPKTNRVGLSKYSYEGNVLNVNYVNGVASEIVAKTPTKTASINDIKYPAGAFNDNVTQQQYAGYPRSYDPMTGPNLVTSGGLVVGGNLPETITAEERAAQYAKDLANYGEALADQRVREAIDTVAARDIAVQKQAEQYKRDLANYAEALAAQRREVIDTVAAKEAIAEKAQQYANDLAKYAKALSDERVQQALANKNTTNTGEISFDAPVKESTFFNDPIGWTIGGLINLTFSSRPAVATPSTKPATTPEQPTGGTTVINETPSANVTVISKTAPTPTATNPTLTKEEQYAADLTNYAKALSDQRAQEVAKTVAAQDIAAQQKAAEYAANVKNYAQALSDRLVKETAARQAAIKADQISFDALPQNKTDNGFIHDYFVGPINTLLNNVFSNSPAVANPTKDQSRLVQDQTAPAASPGGDVLTNGVKVPNTTAIGERLSVPNETVNQVVNKSAQPQQVTKQITDRLDGYTGPTEPTPAYTPPQAAENPPLVKSLAGPTYGRGGLVIPKVDTTAVGDVGDPRLKTYGPETPAGPEDWQQGSVVSDPSIEPVDAAPSQTQEVSFETAPPTKTNNTTVSSLFSNYVTSPIKNYVMAPITDYIHSLFRSKSLPPVREGGSNQPSGVNATTTNPRNN